MPTIFETGGVEPSQRASSVPLLPLITTVCPVCRSPAPAMFGEPTCSNPWARDHGVHLARSQPPSLDERQPTRSTNSAAVPDTNPSAA